MLKSNQPISGAVTKRKPALFGSQLGIRTAALSKQAAVAGKLTIDAASRTQNQPGIGNRGLEFASMPGRSARAHGVSGKQVLQMEGSGEAQGASIPRRKLLFSLGQKNVNQNLL